MNSQNNVDTTFFHWIFPKEQILPTEMPQEQLERLLKEITKVFLTKELSKLELSAFQEFLATNPALETVEVETAVPLETVKTIQDILKTYPTVTPMIELKNRDLSKENQEELKQLDPSNIMITNDGQTFFLQQTTCTPEKEAYKSLEQRIEGAFENPQEREYLNVQINFVMLEGSMKSVTIAEKMTEEGKIILFEEVLPVSPSLDKTFLEPVMHSYALHHPVLSAETEDSQNLVVIASDNTVLRINHLPKNIQENLLTIATSTEPTEYKRPEHTKYPTLQQPKEETPSTPVIKQLQPKKGYTHIVMILILSLIVSIICIACFF